MSIFARQLEEVLKKYNVSLGQLYSIMVGKQRMTPFQIQRLTQASKGISTVSVTLNPDELDQVISAYHLSPDDAFRLHAALLAEAIFRLLWGRIGQQQAESIGMQFLSLLIDETIESPQPLRQFRQAIRDKVRDGDAVQPSSLSLPAIADGSEIAGILDDMEFALSLYDEAMAWLAFASTFTTDPTRQNGYSQLARTLLLAAKEELMVSTSRVAESAPQVAYLTIIESWLKTLPEP